MKCTKCGGRTVLDDVHTYLGHETERRCIQCGRRYPIDPTEAATDKSEKSERSDLTKNEEGDKMAARGTCVDCSREMAIVAKGRCGTCHAKAIKAGIVVPVPRRVAPAVPPPAADVPPEEHPAEQPEAAVSPGISYESEDEKAALAGAPLQQAPVQVDLDQHPVQVSFDERDRQLLTRLEEAARYNRRTLAAEILFRLDRTFDETA